MRLQSLPYIALTLSLIWPGFTDADSDEINPLIVSSGKEATVLKQDPPLYPASALNKRIEGWVILSFVVNELGSTEDIFIVDSSIEGLFEEAAIEAVEKWIYDPATWNGRPVVPAKNSARVIFQISNLRNGGVSSFFYTQYQRALKALDENKNDKTLKIIEKLDKYQARVLVESCYLDLLKGMYHQQVGDFHLALASYKRALHIAKDAVPDRYGAFLRRAVALSIQLRDYSFAIDYFDKLKEADPDSETTLQIGEQIDSVKEYLEGDQPYGNYGVIKSPCPSCEILVPYWSQELLRDQFTFRDVKGV